MSDASPTVAVIIPTHNRRQVIRRALHSVLAQTYRNLEAIVVDDGSTDGTEAIVRSFADTRVRYLRHAQRRGAAAARNTGIKATSAEFIAFQDSDDEWLCEKLERQMAAFQQADNGVGAVYTGFLRLQQNQASYWPARQVKKSGNILLPLLNGNFVTTQAVVVRRHCLAEVGLFDETLPRLQDWELFIRIAKRYEFICIDAPLLLAYHSNTSISADDSLYPAALKQVLAAHQEVFAQDAKALARNYYSLGRSLCAAGEMAEGIGYLMKSLRRNPWRIMCWISLLSALPGNRCYRLLSGLADRASNAFLMRHGV